MVTGGPGSGKTTLIDALARAGVATSPEVGRAVIREELSTVENALPWGDARLFAEKMVVREAAAHAAALARSETVLLDRGVPDVPGFLRVSGLPVSAHIAVAARAHRYHSRVFLAPFWAEIYAHDPECRQPAKLARETEAVMRDTYAGYGYNLVELPRATVGERMEFVFAALQARGEKELSYMLRPVHAAAMSTPTTIIDPVRDALGARPGDYPMLCKNRRSPSRPARAGALSTYGSPQLVRLGAR